MSKTPPNTASTSREKVPSVKKQRYQLLKQLLNPWEISSNRTVTEQTLAKLDVTEFIQNSFTSAELQDLLDRRREQVQKIKGEITNLLDRLDVLRRRFEFLNMLNARLEEEDRIEEID